MTPTGSWCVLSLPPLLHYHMYIAFYGMYYSIALHKHVIILYFQVNQLTFLPHRAAVHQQ